MAPGPSAQSPSQLPARPNAHSARGDPQRTLRKPCTPALLHSLIPWFPNHTPSSAKRNLWPTERATCVSMSLQVLYPSSWTLTLTQQKVAANSCSPNCRTPPAHTGCLLCSPRVVVYLQPSGCHLVEEKHLTPVLTAPLSRCPPRI